MLVGEGERTRREGGREGGSVARSGTRSVLLRQVGVRSRGHNSCLQRGREAAGVTVLSSLWSASATPTD